MDQIVQVIDTIKTNPNDRRILVNSWNPSDIPNMSLPPCHQSFQFYVSNGELSCHMLQRSCDIGCGLPFNIASYSLLTIMIAHLTGLTPGDFIHTTTDTHIYLNHLDDLKEQLKRTPVLFPTLKINRKVTDINDFKLSDFELVDYKPYPAIKMQMSA